MIEIKLENMVEVPDGIVPVLKEYVDVVHLELAKKLPPRRPIDYQIELVPGAKLLAQVAYRMTPSKLVELRKQLIELLDTGLILQSRAPYGALVFF